MTKRFLYVLVVVAALVLLVPTMAMANFAIHGNFVEDTDACAGCHRAHTSVSSITWTDTNNESQSALLTSSATKMEDFCLACHDATSQGADTNVQEGVYEGTLYGTSGDDLNGGGFETFQGNPVTSMHDSQGGSWGAYGGGIFASGDAGADGQVAGANNGETVPIQMDCATCHDPHGSSNYRILKPVVFGNTVGGYDPAEPGFSTEDPAPNAWVQSTEQGWPVGGFRLHTAYPAYIPNYTEARYAKGYNMLPLASNGTPGAENTAKGMTGWCSGCHTTYNEESGTYNAGDGFGLVTRHRHPVNSQLDEYAGPDANLMVIDKLPLAHDLPEGSAEPTATKSDWIECLTCHRAHGTSAIMTGYAAEKSNISGDEINDFITTGIDGEPSALLRNDNRGVCEACHNK
ncbi:MAG TPA: cytochrome c3 family protein [Coriobacteriia bacterium]|nr:cytochrome c3 family protein [Coriobacteriia bacterium]